MHANDLPSTALWPGRSASTAITRIAAGVDGWPEGRDAAAFGEILARALGAELLLISVVPDSPATRAWVGWRGLREEVEADLVQTRDALAPGARTLLDTDPAIGRALGHAIARERQDLLIVGSSRHAAEGHVRIGRRTRQLIGEAAFPLVIVPRSLHHRSPKRLARIGVGYDHYPEAEAALAFADSLASTADASLHVRGVVDDRPVGRSPAATRTVFPEWETFVEAEVDALRGQVSQAAAATRASTTYDTVRGRPADRLLELGRRVDLLVIGSRRWGVAARVLLGSTGEALVHDAACPVAIVPRELAGFADRPLSSRFIPSSV
jgi:nucleotide-binding universal stress UspA family protein